VRHLAPLTAAHTRTVIFLHDCPSNVLEYTTRFIGRRDSNGRSLTEALPGLKWVFVGIVFSGFGRPEEHIREREDMRCWLHMLSQSSSVDAANVWNHMVCAVEPNQDRRAHLASLKQHVGLVEGLIDQKAQLVGGRERVFLGGTGTGCAKALLALFASRVRFAGFFGMQGWLPCSAHLPSQNSCQAALAQWVNQKLSPGDDFEVTPAMLHTPVLLIHGENYCYVPVRSGEQLCEGLVGLGMTVEWRQCGECPPEEADIDDIVRFIARCP